MSPEPNSAELWTPAPERVGHANITRLMADLREQGELDARSYQDLWAWSVEQPEAFWSRLWDFFAVLPERRGHALPEGPRMPGTRWFPAERLNYASIALSHPADDVALVLHDESGERSTLTYGEIAARAGAAASALRAAGVKPGDRVAGVLSNIEATVVAFLATAAIGGTWTLCSPEFGEASILARLGQLEPTVLLTVDGYQFAGRTYDVRAKMRAIRAQLPSVTTHVELTSGLALDPDGPARPVPTWSSFIGSATPLAPTEFLEVPFEHPLWILFSSGTTGIPKAMVQGHGGIVLEHLKAIGLHFDISARDVFFWYTSTAWMMWNYAVGVLLRGATVVMYDGAPDPHRLWQLLDQESVTCFGGSPGFYQQSLERGLPAAPPASLRTLGSTGSPLLAETQRRLTAALPDVHVASVSGGTDVCSGFVGPAPVLPVTVGQMQCRMLGVDAVAVDPQGDVVEDAVGELVVRLPMPSMPLAFWNDPDQRRYRAAYFDRFPGWWHHGDWIRFTPDGQSVITGRSDATLNRGGVRMGTSEFYQVLEQVPWIADSMVIDASDQTEGRNLLVLYVVPRPETETVPVEALARLIRTQISPRHVPDLIVPVEELPYTLTGKRCEVPVKRMLMGADRQEVSDHESLRNPEALVAVVTAAREKLASN